MPLGPWKSKWEIHREDMARRDAEHREGRAKFDARWLELREECRDLRADHDRELAETRLFNRELSIRVEKASASLDTTLGVLAERVLANTEEVKAQTQAILRLVDRFEEAGGRPPV